MTKKGHQIFGEEESAPQQRKSWLRLCKCTIIPAVTLSNIVSGRAASMKVERRVAMNWLSKNLQWICAKNLRSQRGRNTSSYRSWRNSNVFDVSPTSPCGNFVTTQITVGLVDFITIVASLT